MPITLQHTEEALSVAYVSAVLAKSGYSFGVVNMDYGVDIEVRKVLPYSGGLVDCGVVYDLQLKATKNWQEDDQNIIYDMQVDAYNKLVFRREHSMATCFLIILCLPEDVSQWVGISSEELSLRKCCYYTSVEGENTTNVGKKRIKIPKQNIFSPEKALELQRGILEGGGEI